MLETKKKEELRNAVGKNTTESDSCYFFNVEITLLVSPCVSSLFFLSILICRAFDANACIIKRKNEKGEKKCKKKKKKIVKSKRVVKIKDITFE